MIGADRPVLDLPPAFRARRAEGAGAYRTALEVAADAGAGTFVWSADDQRLELAVVFEPDRPLGSAWFAALVFGLAAGDALAGVAPAQTEITFAWPDRIEVNGGLIGGIRAAAPPDVPRDAVPEWLVVALILRLRYPAGFDAPGLIAEQTSLEEEGFTDPDPRRLAESFSRNLLFWTDRWTAGDSAEIAKHWLARASESARAAGVGLDLDTGDLLSRDPSGRRDLADALARSSWSLAEPPLSRQ